MEERRIVEDDYRRERFRSRGPIIGVVIVLAVIVVLLVLFLVDGDSDGGDDGVRLEDVEVDIGDENG